MKEGKNGSGGDQKARLAQSDFDPLEAEARYRCELTAEYQLGRGRRCSAPASISVLNLIKDKEAMPEAEAGISRDDLDIVAREWRALVSELDLFVPSEVDVSCGDEAVTDMEIGRGASDEQPESPFASSASSTQYDLEDHHSYQGGLLPAFAVALGKENTKPKPSEKGEAKMVPDFGAPGEYKNSIAFRRALPALLKRKPLVLGGEESVMSGGSECEPSEPEWEIPSFGVLPESDRHLVSAQSFEQRIELWLEAVLRDSDDESSVHNLPPVIETESDLTKTNWEDFEEPSNEDPMVMPTASEMGHEREREPMASGTHSRSADLSGGTAAEQEDDQDLYVLDDHFPGQALKKHLPLFSHTASDATTRSHHVGSSVISGRRIERFAAREAVIWANFEVAEKRRELQRERVELVEGRGSIAGENLAELRYVCRWDFSWRFPLPAPLEVFAQFLEDAEIDDEEYLELKDRFDNAYVLGCNRPSMDGGWPARPCTPPDIRSANWRRGWLDPPQALLPPPAAEEEEDDDDYDEEEEGDLSSLDEEDYREWWERLQAENRRRRLAEAAARGRSAGLIDGIKAYRKAQEPKAWGQESSDERSSTSMLLPSARDEYSRLKYIDVFPWNKGPYVLHFVDDEGFPPVDRTEMAVLQEAFKEGYDRAFHAASTDMYGFVTSLKVIPSLDEFMEGRERIFY